MSTMATAASGRAPVLGVEGIGFWASGLPGLEALRAFLRAPDAAPEGQPPPRRPAPDMLPANERRRAPDTVLLALQAAQQACAMAARDPATLPSVFASCHGDLAITDAICATLARAPLELSPTRFHNSVHNAAAGYWTIASGCHAPATALSAHAGSFAQGLLEAAAQALVESTPVLLVGYDAASPAPLADVSPSEGLLALALVLSPPPSLSSAATACRLSLALESEAAPHYTGPLQQRLGGNAMASVLPLAEALALGRHGSLCLHAGPGSRLRLELAA